MKQEYTDLIEKYFDSGLNTDEKKEFENLIEKDVEFKREFEEYKITQELIQAEGRIHLKQKLVSLDLRLKKKNYIKRLSIAAGIAGILIVAGYYTIFQPEKSVINLTEHEKKEEKNTSWVTDSSEITKDIPNKEVLQKNFVKSKKRKEKSDSLFAANYRPFRHESLEPTMRGDQNDNQRNIFLKLYWDENYSEALLQYNKLSEEEKLNPNLRFQYAICLIENKQYKKAEAILEVLKAENKSRFGKDIENYLRLLKQRQMQD